MRDREALFESTGRDDLILPFQIDPYGLRGRLVRLGAVSDAILARHGYPDPVAAMLGETMALAVCLAGSLKYEGVFTLQTKGDGPISLLMADVTTDGAIRAYATFDEERVAAVAPSAVVERSVPRLLGGGYIAFTVDQGSSTDRYQGIVELSGQTLSECTHAYFQQSEQLGTGVKIAAARVGDAWRAGGIMVQRMPYSRDLPGRPSEDDYEELWRTAVTLKSSARSNELVGDDVTPDQLLYRLFHEEGVRAYEANRVTDSCRCSSSRVERVLSSLSVQDLEDLKVDGQVVVTCEFCKREWRYDDAALKTVRTEQESPRV